MKNRFLLKTFILLVVLVVGSLNVWAQVYDLVTDASSLAAGDVILITNSKTAGSVYALGTTQNTNNRKAESVTVTNTNKITSLGDAQEITLEKKNNSGYFTFKVGSKYLYAASPSANQLKSRNSEAYWEITINTTTHVAAITDKTNTSNRNKMDYNPNNQNPIFSCYSSISNNLFVFKKHTYTITAISNNNSYGTVSLSGSVITGSPKSGYRYASPAYTVSSGSATVSQDGNAFTVTPTSDCTITINFEAIPTHTITCVADPVGSGTFDAVSSLYEGSTTDITASANSGYKFTGWSVSGTGASLSSTSTNPTTLTMGTADATITATFEAVTTYAITYSVNGHETTINVEEDADVDLSAPASALIPVGYYFKGWRTEELALTNDDPDDYVTSSTSTEDITYYAVVAVKTEIAADTYEKLGNTSFDGDDTYVLCGIQGGSGGDGSTLMYLSSYGAIDEDISWGGCTSTPATVAPVKFRLSGTASQLVAKDNSGNYLTKSNDEKKFAMSSTSKTVYLDTDGSIKTASNGWLLRYNHNNGSGGFRWYNGTTGQQVYFYKVVDNCTYGSFCTTVSPISLDDDVTISGDLDVTYSLTVQSNTILTVNGTLSIEGGGSITIEDGGQLITNSSVALTYNKNITAASRDANWYTIATPVHYKKDATDTDSIRVSDVTNLILDKDSYDFFYYDEYNSTLGGAYWMNYKASHPGFPFKVGQGFLYRNDGSKLSFAGTSNSDDSYTYDLQYHSEAGDLAGINLIGNPYPHNITMDYVTVGDGTLTGGYVLSKSNGWAAEVAATIAPTQGFLVQISEAGQTATINKTEPDPGKSRANRDYIKFIVNNSQYEDATFALFDKCDGLNKIEHRNADIPMIYIPQDGQNFAIATMSDETQSFSLNFKAKTTGKYTLSYQTKGNYSYLHVIDRLTGEDIDMLLDGEYSFIASPQDNAARFIVKLSYNANGNNTNENDIFAFQSGSDIIVNGEGELQVFDVTGRQVMNTTINGMESINIPNQGVYIFRLNEKVQKIVVR